MSGKVAGNCGALVLRKEAQESRASDKGMGGPWLETRVPGETRRPQKEMGSGS